MRTPMDVYLDAVFDLSSSGPDDKPWLTPEQLMQATPLSRSEVDLSDQVNRHLRGMTAKRKKTLKRRSSGHAWAKVKKSGCGKKVRKKPSQNNQKAFLKKHRSRPTKNKDKAQAITKSATMKAYRAMLASGWLWKRLEADGTSLRHWPADDGSGDIIYNQVFGLVERDDGSISWIQNAGAFCSSPFFESALKPTSSKNESA